MGKKIAVRILSLAVVAYILYSVSLTLYQNWQVNKQVNDLKSQINDLKSANEQTKEKLTYYQSQSYIDTIARERFNLEAPGEKVMAIEPAEIPKTAPPKPKDTRSNPQKWWDYFFGG